MKSPGREKDGKKKNLPTSRLTGKIRCQTNSIKQKALYFAQ